MLPVSFPFGIVWTRLNAPAKTCFYRNMQTSESGDEPQSAFSLASFGEINKSTVKDNLVVIFIVFKRNTGLNQEPLTFGHDC